MIRTVCLFVLVAALFACGDKKEAAPTAPKPSAELASFTLKVDPGEAISVEDAKEAAPKDGVVAVGRIRNIVKGFASFQLTDASLDYCGGGADKMDDCATPWDYCCIPQTEVNTATLLVEARDKNGKVLESADLPGLRLLDLVVVKGKLTKDEHGNVTIEATGWHRRERPELRDGLSWPE